MWLALFCFFAAHLFHRFQSMAKSSVNTTKCTDIRMPIWRSTIITRTESTANRWYVVTEYLSFGCTFWTFWCREVILSFAGIPGNTAHTAPKVVVEYWRRESAGKASQTDASKISVKTTVTEDGEARRLRRTSGHEPEELLVWRHAKWIRRCTSTATAWYELVSLILFQFPLQIYICKQIQLIDYVAILQLLTKEAFF